MATTNKPKLQCRGKCALTAKPDPVLVDRMEMGFRSLVESDSNSLLKKNLTRQIFDNIKFARTTYGATLLDCVQSGFQNHDSNIGVYAPDSEAYKVYGELFNPVIEDYHGFKPTDVHPDLDFGDPDTLGNLDPTNKYIVSTRIRCGRSIQNFPFMPLLTEDQYKELETKIIVALGKLQGELAGQYYPITGMDPGVQKKQIESGLLFKEGDRFLMAANACRFWPTGRGVYHNEKSTFSVWINEEDHMRIIALENGGNLGNVYKRWMSGVLELSKYLPFLRDERLGFLNFCPTNLGNAIRASVHIKLPKLTKNMKKLEQMAEQLHLQVRGGSGEHTTIIGGLVDISNKHRLGITEYEAIKKMHDGVLRIIKAEKTM